MRALLLAFRLVTGSRELRPYLWRPLLISLGLYAGSVVVGAVVITSLFSAWLGPWGVLGGFAAVLASLFLSGPLFLALSSLISAFHWDPLGRRVEALCGAGDQASGLNTGQMILDFVQRLLLAAALLSTAFVLSFTAFFWLGPVLAGLLAFCDFTGAPLQRRGVIMPVAFFQAIKKKGALGFLAGCCLLSAFPFIMLFFHPIMACAGTLVVCELQPTLPSPKPSLGREKL